MAAMQQRSRLQPAGLYRGVGHQNPAPVKGNKTIDASQPARRYGDLRDSVSLGYCILDSSFAFSSDIQLIFNHSRTLLRFMEEATKRALVLGATKNK